MGASDVVRLLSERVHSCGGGRLARLTPKGVGAKVLAAAMEALGVPLPDEVCALYALQNGLGLSVREFRESPWLCLEDAIEVRAAVAEDYAVVGLAAPRLCPPEIRQVAWSPGWLPVAQIGNGDLWLLDLDPGPAGRVGQIISRFHESEGARVCFPSLGKYLLGIDCDWLATIAAADDLPERPYPS